MLVSKTVSINLCDLVIIENFVSKINMQLLVNSLDKL